MKSESYTVISICSVDWFKDFILSDVVDFSDSRYSYLFRVVIVMEKGCQFLCFFLKIIVARKSFLKMMETT